MILPFWSVCTALSAPPQTHFHSISGRSARPDHCRSAGSARILALLEQLRALEVRLLYLLIGKCERTHPFGFVDFPEAVQQIGVSLQSARSREAEVGARRFRSLELLRLQFVQARGLRVHRRLLAATLDFQAISVGVVRGERAFLDVLERGIAKPLRSHDVAALARLASGIDCASDPCLIEGWRGVTQLRGRRRSGHGHDKSGDSRDGETKFVLHGTSVRSAPLLARNGRPRAESGLEAPKK